jgi:hypothetical protein
MQFPMVKCPKCDSQNRSDLGGVCRFCDYPIKSNGEIERIETPINQELKTCHSCLVGFYDNGDSAYNECSECSFATSEMRMKYASTFHSTPELPKQKGFFDRLERIFTDSEITDRPKRPTPIYMKLAYVFWSVIGIWFAIFFIGIVYESLTDSGGAHVCESPQSYEDRIYCNDLLSDSADFGQFR